MASAQFHFLPDLPFFLTGLSPDGWHALEFASHQTLKHVLESAGLPHTEVGALLVNDNPAGLDTLLADGDRVEVAPPPPGMQMPAQPQFVLDGHLGRLAAGLRMLGCDTLYRNDYDDRTLAEIAATGRILLTRDRRLLMRKQVQYGYCPRSLQPDEQLAEVARRYDLTRHSAPFQRCLRCNELLEWVAKADVLDQLQPLTLRYYETFHRCPACGQIYWPGSHYERMLRRIQSLR